MITGQGPLKLFYFRFESSKCCDCRITCDFYLNTSDLVSKQHDIRIGVYYIGSICRMRLS